MNMFNEKISIIKTTYIYIDINIFMYKLSLRNEVQVGYRYNFLCSSLVI